MDPLNTTAAIDDALHGRLGKQPATGRKELEEALAFYGPIRPGDQSYFRAVLEAARKHLETLPKPEPKFRVVGQRRCGGRETGNFLFAFRDNADGEASDWMATGKYNSVAVEQVSA